MDAKFKVGDKVRVVDDAGGAKIGDVGIVTRVDTSCPYMGDAYYHISGLSDGDGLYGCRLELVPQFAVGDRVEYKDEYVSGVGVIAQIEGDDEFLVTVEDKDRGRAYYLGDTARSFEASSLTPADPQHPLTIVAGRYYKTRDGRKVGPMERYEDEGYFWKAPATLGGFGPFWREDGKYHKNCETPRDLIAEWPTATGNPAAQVDNLRDEYGPPVAEYRWTPKFKVGDRVAFRDTYGLSSVRGKEATVISVDGCGIQVDMGTGHTGISTEAPESLRLVAPATTGKVDAGGGFKEGDRIRLISNPCGKQRIGDEYTAVKRTQGAASSVHYKNDDGQTSWRPGTYFELATTPQPAIVALIENGQPLPSSRPHVHSSRSDAEREAGRPAGVHKGQEFGVYELVATRKEARVYEHEWQRLAAGGVTTRIAAIKELRRVSGLGLYEAKVGVEKFLERAA